MVKRFLYFGLKLDSFGITKPEIQRQIQLGRIEMNQIQKMRSSANMTKIAKVQILAFPVCLCGPETRMINIQN